MSRSAAARLASRNGHPYNFTLLPLVGDLGQRVNIEQLRSEWPWLDAVKLRREAIPDGVTSVRLTAVVSLELLVAIVDAVLTGDWAAAPWLSTQPSPQFCTTLLALGAVGCLKGVEACERHVLEHMTAAEALQWTPAVGSVGFSERFDRKIRECVNVAFPVPVCQSELWRELEVCDVRFWLSFNHFVEVKEAWFLIALSWWWQKFEPARQGDVELLLQNTECFRALDETLFDQDHPLYPLVRNERLRRTEFHIVEFRPRPWITQFNLAPCDGLLRMTGQWKDRYRPY